MAGPRIRITGADVDASEVRRFCAASPTPPEGSSVLEGWRAIEIDGRSMGWIAPETWALLRGRLEQQQQSGRDVHFDEGAPRVDLRATQPGRPSVKRPQSPPPPAISGIRAQDLRAIVVTDDSQLRERLLRVLAARGVRALGLNRADRARAAIRREPPHLVIADADLENVGVLVRDARRIAPTLTAVLVGVEDASDGVDLAFPRSLDARTIVGRVLDHCRVEQAGEG